MVHLGQCSARRWSLEGSCVSVAETTTLTNLKGGEGGGGSWVSVAETTTLTSLEGGVGGGLGLGVWVEGNLALRV